MADIVKNWRETLFQDWHRYSPDPPRWKAAIVALLFDAGFLAVFLFRLSQLLHARQHRLLAKIVRRFNLSVSAAELNPAARVEPGLFLPHPYGVGIGRGCELGKDVTVHQGVSLGAKTVSVEEDLRRTEYPTVEEGAILFPHALAYGPVRIGAAAIILGNSVVSCDVPPGTTYGGVPAREIRSARGFDAGDLRRTARPAASAETPEGDGG